MAEDFQGKVEVVLVSPPDSQLPGQPVEQVEVSLEGFLGDKHAGLTMRASSSQKPYPKGTEIRNVRQVSLVSLEELEEVAQRLGVPQIRPEWVGANLLISGVPGLTKLPAGTRFYFEDGAGLVVEGENMPCTTAGGSLAAQFPEIEGLANQFPKHAIGKRGLVAWVERAGRIRQGEAVVVRHALDVRS
jgi:hypothetical protein